MIYDVYGNEITVSGSTVSGKTYSPIFDNTQIIGHQANTIAQFKTYKNNGLKFVEADIVISGDNVPLLGHNDNFTIGGTTYYVSQMTYTDIIATGKSFDTLSDLLMNCKKFNIALYLDIKTGTTSNITAVYNLVRDWGMLNMVVWGTISLEVARVLGALNENLIFDYWGGNETTIDTALNRMPKCALLIFHYGTHDSMPGTAFANTVKYAHQKGVKSYNWTVSQKDVANADFNTGTDYVMSNSLTNADME